MPMVSNAVASKGAVYKESDVRRYPSSMLVYVAMEIASAAILTVGEALCALGQAERLASPTHMLSQTDTYQCITENARNRRKLEENCKRITCCQDS
jgi:hypothetical protein